MIHNVQPGTRISEYLLEEKIGEGSFSQVWRARHHIWSDERVAIKIPTDAEYVRYLRREGIVVHGLRHPNIVRVLGLDPYAEIPYLVMELIRGPSLRGVIDQHPGGLPIETATTILRGMLEAMRVAHDAGVLHRDLKPGNILLDLDGRPLEALTPQDVKVSDFGLGIHDDATFQSIVQSASLDREQRIVGTLAYMAPELRDGHAEPSPASDLYSVGVILFEMLTGSRPAGAELPSTVRADVPESLDRIFSRLYAARERRFQQAADVLAELSGPSPAAVPLPPPQAGASVPPPPPAAAHAGVCPSCGAAADADDQFCTQCGTQLVAQVRRCGKCGAYPGPRDRYCIFCGARLDMAAEV